MTIQEHELEGFDENEGCLYQKENVGPLSSLFISKSIPEIDNCEIPCPPLTYFDDNFTSLQHFTQGTDYAEVTGLKCPVNAWALSSN